MALPNSMEKVIPASSEGAITSYDFYDLATGRASKTLYCGDTDVRTPYYSGAVAGQIAPTYRMSPNQWYSGQGWVTSGAGWIRISFDMPLNRPLMLEGAGIVNVPVIERNEIANPFTLPSLVFAELYKVSSNSTQTFIASGSSFWAKSTAISASNYHLHAINLDIPVTHLMASDTLRLRIVASGASQYFIFGCDPYGRTSSTEIFDGGGTSSWGTTTALTFNMPLRVGDI